MNKLYVFVILFFAANISHSQTFIEGKVADVSGSPIQNINVIVCEAESKSILSYGFSDKDGMFRITINSQIDSIDISTNSCFFTKENKRIPNANAFVQFTLKEETQELKGVTVTASSMEMRGDTIEYFVGSFAQNEDKSIEDVIKRMPGIEVEDNGNILYQGAPIQKFYIEGLDLMDGRYSTVSKNLPHQSVASVEIYENHQPIRMLENKVSSEQASINIKLSKDVAMTGSGRVGIGATPFLWDINATPMLFSGKLQMVASYQTNNIGDNLVNSTRKFTFEQMNSDRPSENSKELSIKEPAQPIFDQKRYIDNISHLGTVNLLTPISKTTQLRVNLHYLNNEEKQSGEQLNKVFMPTDTVVYVEEIYNNIYNDKLLGNITFDRNDNDIYLKDDINFSKMCDKSFGHVNNDGKSVNQEHKFPSTYFSNDLRVIFPVKQHLLDFVSYNSFGATPETLKIEPGVFDTLLNDGKPYTKAQQEFNNNQFYTNEAISGIFIIDRITINTKLGISYLNKKIYSQISIMDSVVRLSGSFKNDVTHTYTKPYFNTNLEYKLNNINIVLSLPLSYNIASVSSMSAGKNIRKIFLTPSLSINLKAGNYWTISCGGEYQRNIENFASQHENYVLKDYQSLSVEDAPLSVSGKIIANTRILFKQPFISLNATLSYMYQHQHSDITYKYDVDGHGTSFLQLVNVPSNSNLHTISGTIKKFISPIRTTLGIKGNLGFMSGHTILNDSSAFNSSVSTSIVPNIMVKITDWFHVDYTFNYNQILSKTNNIEKSDVVYMRHNCDMMFFPGKEHLICLISEIYNYKKKTFLYMDIIYQYSLSKHRIDFEFKISNIFNNDKYVSYYSGQFSLMESIYRIRPREIICSVKFRF